MQSVAFFLQIPGILVLYAFILVIMTFFVDSYTVEYKKKKKTTVNYLRTFLTSNSHHNNNDNNNNSIDRRMISVSSSGHYLDMCIYIYVCMRHDTLSLTSSGRLLFYHNDFDNHLSLPLFSINGQIYLCDRTHSTESNDSNAIISKGI